MFREWLAWNAPDGGPDQHDNTMQALIELGDVLIRRGLARFDDGALTAARAAGDLSGPDARLPLRASRRPHWPPRR